MRIDDMVAELQQLPLDEDETALYVHLVSAGPSGAEEQILVHSSDPLSIDFEPPVVELWDTARAKAREGVRFRGAFRMTAAARKRVRPWLSDPGFQVGELDVERTVHFDIVDDRELVLWVAVDESDNLDAGDVALWSNAPELVATQRLAFDAVWETASPLRRT